MKKLLASLAVTSMLAMPVSSQAGLDPFLGEIMTFAGNFCPTGYLEANGAILPINQNQALFSILGTTYGGNGITTFALPDIKPILTVNRVALMSCIAVAGIFPSRN